MVGETLAEELLDPLRMWLDPVATAPGSVPNTLLSVAQHKQFVAGERGIASFSTSSVLHEVPAAARAT